MSEERAGRNDQDTKGIAVPIEWGSIEDLPTLYANQLLVTHTGSEFYLVFGELIPPLMVEQGQEPPDHVSVYPVAKIAITHNNMLAFGEAIQRNIDNFMDKIKPKG